MLDVGAPDAITQLSGYDVAGAVPGRGLAYHAGRAVGVTYNNGSAPDLFVFDAPYGGVLQLRGALNLATDNTAVALYGDRAYVGTKTPSQGLRVVDLGNPAAPVGQGSLATGEVVNGVAVKDSLVYLVSSSNTAELQIAHGGVDVEPILVDANGDGLVTTACLGNSNTQIVGSPLRYWCEVADDLITRPTWRTRNRGAPYATVTAGWTLYGQPDGPTQLATALATDAPDAAVFAFGTNDISFVIASHERYGTPLSVEGIVSAYRSILATAEQHRLAPFVALAPRDGQSTPSDHSELVHQLDNRPAARVPGGAPHRFLLADGAGGGLHAA